ncbi:cupin domain-containing protein [Endozoicomonas sp.]|uniref:cupin domain-containing protein n=1 Tax=Endozoicomonas sp. TaxID=1892382 RepID=UPI00383BBFBD
MLRCVFPLVMAVGCAALYACPDEEKLYDGKLQVKTIKVQSVTDDNSPIKYPDTDKPLVTTLRIHTLPGAGTGWHYHPHPGYAYVISGTMEVTMESGRKNHYETDQAIYELVNTPHNGRCVSETPCDLIVTFIGAENEPVTVMLPQHDD